MNTEEKAKAYDEALKKIHEIIRMDNHPVLPKEIGEYLFPELRESEDERMMRAIGLALTDVSEERFTSLGTTLKDCLSYLENQKEQKPIQTSEEKEYIRTLKNLISGFIRDKQPEDVAYYQRVYDWLDGRHIEQKSAEWSEDIIRKAIKEVGLTQHQIDWFKTNVFPPKQEWSDEDERMRNQLIYDVEHHKKEGLISAKRNKATKVLYNEIEKCYDEKIAWLKSLHNRPKPSDSWRPSHNTLPIEQQLEAAIEQQVEAAMIAIRGEKPSKSQQWSEDDEDNLQAIIRIIEDNDSDWKELTDWLKSLRPQYHWKPSEQEKGALRTAICVLTEERSFPKAAGHLQAILDAFEGKESRKDWKPSEEEMEALKDALRVSLCEPDMRIPYEHLSSLYEQLQKLM